MADEVKAEEVEAEEVEMVMLDASTGQQFTVPVPVAKMSVTLNGLIEDAGTENPIPIPNVTGPVLDHVLKYCRRKYENPPTIAEDGTVQEKPEETEWNQEFVKVDQATLFELILAANYLDIKSLLDLTCKTVANMIKGKTPEEIRVIFNIKNDFTPEEEEAVKNENSWVE